jgi:hypothetical protein
VKRTGPPDDYLPEHLRTFDPADWHEHVEGLDDDTDEALAEYRADPNVSDAQIAAHLDVWARQRYSHAVGQWLIAHEDEVPGGAKMKNLRDFQAYKRDRLAEGDAA